MEKLKSALGIGSEKQRNQSVGEPESSDTEDGEVRTGLNEKDDTRNRVKHKKDGRRDDLNDTKIDKKNERRKVHVDSSDSDQEERDARKAKEKRHIGRKFSDSDLDTRKGTKKSLRKPRKSRKDESDCSSTQSESESDSEIDYSVKHKKTHQRHDSDSSSDEEPKQEKQKAKQINKSHCSSEDDSDSEFDIDRKTKERNKEKGRHDSRNYGLEKDNKRISNEDGKRYQRERESRNEEDMERVVKQRRRWHGSDDDNSDQRVTKSRRHDSHDSDEDGNNGRTRISQRSRGGQHREKKVNIYHDNDKSPRRHHSGSDYSSDEELNHERQKAKQIYKKQYRDDYEDCEVKHHDYGSDTDREDEKRNQEKRIHGSRSYPLKKEILHDGNRGISNQVKKRYSSERDSSSEEETKMTKEIRERSRWLDSDEANSDSDFNQRKIRSRRHDFNEDDNGRKTKISLERTRGSHSGEKGYLGHKNDDEGKQKTDIHGTKDIFETFKKLEQHQSKVDGLGYDDIQRSKGKRKMDKGEGDEQPEAKTRRDYYGKEVNPEGQNRLSKNDQKRDVRTIRTDGGHESESNDRMDASRSRSSKGADRNSEDYGREKRESRNESYRGRKHGRDEDDNKYGDKDRVHEQRQHREEHGTRRHEKDQRTESSKRPRHDDSGCSGRKIYDDDKYDYQRSRR